MVIGQNRRSSARCGKAAKERNRSLLARNLGYSKKMSEPRKINKQKVFTGIILICAGVLMMLLGEESASPVIKTIWVGLFGLGIFFYLWGRFFSREDA